MANLWYLLLSILAAVLSSACLSCCAWICGCWEDDEDEFDMMKRDIVISQKRSVKSPPQVKEAVEEFQAGVTAITKQDDRTKEAAKNFRQTRKFKDAVHLAYEMEKLKKKPSILQLTRALQMKQAPPPPPIQRKVSLCPHGNKAADCYFCALDEDNCGVQAHQHRPQSSNSNTNPLATTLFVAKWKSHGGQKSLNF